MISFDTCAGTSAYAWSCIGLCAARPWVRDRRSVAYPKSSASGTSTRITFWPPASSIRSILPRRVLERHRARDLEGHLAGVDLVVGPVGERRADVHHRVAGQDAAVERLL